MNPSGMRMEDKQIQQQQQQQQDHMEVRSTHSYKSTHSSRSSVLERAREYNRRIEKQNHEVSASRSRAKSLERNGGGGSFSEAGSSAVNTPRSQSAGRVNSTSQSSATGGGSRMSTRERAMKSVRKDVGELGGSGGSSGNMNRRGGGGGVPSQTTDHTQPLTPASHMSSGGGRSHSSHVSRPAPTTPRTPPSANAHNNNNSAPAANNNNQNSRRRPSVEGPSKQNQKPSPVRSMKSSQQPKEEGQDAIVTPELLVDALSGHEDGLLAIAEKLMEHYDAGYDVMGEAIIDAFADVQKLFQHVVEAAHMEGAAFEASRREVEMAELRRAAAAGELSGQDGAPLANASSPAAGGGGGTPGGPNRHDEFIDQDVKDAMSEAIRQGASLREHGKHAECYELYEHACQEASAMLPVDSDHRGRLQLSIARAESMSADRACAILRYAMDDVLRSGLQPGMVVMPDPSKRADVVLNRPQGHSSMSGVTGQAGVVQSGDEALASLMEEMKEIMGAPVFKDTPLQSVARRFWMALNDAQKSQQKNEERLEQNLGKLKGDYLLARAEWEEQLNQSKEVAEGYKEKYSRLKMKDTAVKGEDYMDQARNFNQRGMGDSRSTTEGSDINNLYGSMRSGSGRPVSVASMGSGLAQQAKTIVNSMKSFDCNAVNERNGPMMASEMGDDEMRYEGRDRRPRGGGTNSSSKSYSRSASRNKSSRSFREYSKSPQRVDV